MLMGVLEYQNSIMCQQDIIQRAIIWRNNRNPPNKIIQADTLETRW